jgi:pimeloyl-ACP methyl ester carboxylesterase
MRSVVLADGLRLVVRDRGTGIPVLLVHALGETHLAFDRLIELLPDGLRVLAPDQRGVGESDKPLEGYRLQDAASDMVGLLDALDVPAAWIVGSSSGGYVAQQIAVSHPDRLLGLVLVGAPRSLLDAGPLGAILESFHDPVTSADLAALNRGLAVPETIPADFLAVQDAAALTIPRHVWLAEGRGLVEATPPTVSGSIVVPTLLLSGADDELLGKAQAAELAEAIAGSRLVTYERTGHFVLWERPEWVARDLVEYVTAPPLATPPKDQPRLGDGH